jgi:MFS family permease
MGDDYRAAWSVAVLFLTNVLAFVDRSTFSLVLIVIQPTLSLSDLQVGLLGGTAFALLYSFACVPLSLLSEVAASRPRMLFAAVLAWSLAVALSAVPLFGMLFVARMGVGLGEAVVAPAAFSLISDLYRAKSAKAVAVYVAGSFVGVAVSYFLSAAVTSGAWGYAGLVSWQVLFLALGVAGGAFSFVLLTAKEARGAKPLAVQWRHVTEELRAKRLFYVCFCGAILAYGAAMSSFAVFQLFFFKEAAGMQDTRFVAVVLGLLALTVAPLGAVGAGVASDYLQNVRRVDWASGALLAGAMAVYGVASLVKTQWTAAAFALTGITMFLEGVMYALGAAVLQSQVAANLRALSAGVLMTCVSFGILIGPAMTGALKERVGVATALLIVSCVFSIPAMFGFAIVAVEYRRIQRLVVAQEAEPVSQDAELT